MIPNLSVFWTIFFVLLMAWLLNRLLFTPITRVMRDRREIIRSARERAQAAAARAESAAAECEEKTAAARAEIYRQMDETRRAALRRRAEMLAETRSETEATIAHATDRLTAQTDEVRGQLERDANALGAAIAERVLGRKTSSQ